MVVSLHLPTQGMGRHHRSDIIPALQSDTFRILHHPSTRSRRFTRPQARRTAQHTKREKKPSRQNPDHRNPVLLFSPFFSLAVRLRLSTRTRRNPTRQTPPEPIIVRLVLLVPPCHQSLLGCVSTVRPTKSDRPDERRTSPFSRATLLMEENPHPCTHCYYCSCYC